MINLRFSLHHFLFKIIKVIIFYYLIALLFIKSHFCVIQTLYRGSAVRKRTVSSKQSHILDRNLRYIIMNETGNHKRA